MNRPIILLLCPFFFACQNDISFVKKLPKQTGIDFQNQLDYTEEINTYTYRNFYNGAGVAIGDINNDGLSDLYFSGNLVDNKLYINKGNWQFEDVTESAGVSCPSVWSTGVNMVDINGDGWLDIYVCKSGPPGGKNRSNELFINQKDGTFTEEAQSYGLANEGLSVHSVFLDYDADGDLDMYLLNNSLRSIGVYDFQQGQREQTDTTGGNRLYRNEGEKFVDVTLSSGIFSSAIGFGLGVTSADINLDGFPDLYISNDFFERDYLYINNGNGTFSERLTQLITEISMGSMGADIADMDNDGWPEIYVTEMLPSSWVNSKSKIPFEKWDKYVASVGAGYHHQFTRNTLQTPMGVNHENLPIFAEISRFSGVSATDWSWGALLADLDLDGNKDIFVTNGIAKDLMDQDYVAFYADQRLKMEEARNSRNLLTTLIDKIPSTQVPNRLFLNKGQLHFEDISNKSGLDALQYSNGAAYGDLDNDGDLDLVINTIDDFPLIYENRSKRGNYLKIIWEGGDKNSSAIGAQIRVFSQGELKQYYEQNPVKGYMSSMDHQLIIGLGNLSVVDSLCISWPTGGHTTLLKPELNKEVVIKENYVSKHKGSTRNQTLDTIYKEDSVLNFRHKESKFSDFDTERLLFWMKSNKGPKMKYVSLFTSEKMDLLLGGSSGFPTQIILNIGETDQQLIEISGSEPFEDSDFLVYDFDKDSQAELFVASGSCEYPIYSSNYSLRMYDVVGNFIRQSTDVIPREYISTSFVDTLDFNTDGWTDIIKGNYYQIGGYGLPGGLTFLRNEQGRRFVIDSLLTSEFDSLGMITDGKTIDIEGDGDTDIVIVGEWAAVKIILNEQSKFRIESVTSAADERMGLWQTVETADWNNDGIVDFSVGNLGLNTRFKVSKEEPMKLYVNDFDRNGSVEQIITINQRGQNIPVVQLDDLWKQVPQIKKKFLSYEKYAQASIKDLFDVQLLNESHILSVNELRSGIFLSSKTATGKWTYQFNALPDQAQWTINYAMLPVDVNNDGFIDLIAGGNLSRAKPELGIYMAGKSTLFLSDNQGNFTYVPNQISGILINGEIRSINSVTIKNEQYISVGVNDEKVRFYKKK